MSKPTPPSRPTPAWTPQGVDMSTPNAADVDFMGFPQPSGSVALNIEDVSPFVEPLAPPVRGAQGGSSDETKSACETCGNCWEMKLGGQFKNRKADGSEYLLTERFCMYKENLVSLSERVVYECSRHIPKTTP